MYIEVHNYSLLATARNAVRITVDCIEPDWRCGMFISTRIVNGLVALLALFLCVAIFPAVGVSAVITQIAVGCALLVLFFACDVIFRKSGGKADIWFCFAWTLFFAYMLTATGMREGNAPKEIVEPLVSAMIIATFFGLPLLANGIYFCFLLSEKMSKKRFANKT